MPKFKCDTLGDFQTLCHRLSIFHTQIIPNWQKVISWLKTLLCMFIKRLWIFHKPEWEYWRSKSKIRFSSKITQKSTLIKLYRMQLFCDFQTLCNLVKCIILPRSKIQSLVDKILPFLECWIVIFVTVFHGKLDEDFGLLLRAIKSLNQMANLESWHMSSSSQQRGKKIVGGFRHQCKYPHMRAEDL